MIKKLARWILMLFLTLLGILSFVTPTMAATEVWESYTTGDDAAAQVYGVTWYGQTFTTSPYSHSAVDVRFLAYRVGTPSTVTVSIRAVGDDGFPSGDDLTSGTIDGDSLTDSTGGSWYGVSLTETNLDYGETYAICFRAEAGDVSNYIALRADSTGAYSGGQAINSTSSKALPVIWNIRSLPVSAAHVIPPEVELMACPPE